MESKSAEPTFTFLRFIIKSVIKTVNLYSTIWEELGKDE